MRKRRLMNQINVVPYIDVMLVLLVIFMITTPLLTQGVSVDLPKAQANPLSAQQLEPLIISVDKSGQYYLNIAEHPETAMSIQALVNVVVTTVHASRQAGAPRPVLIRGDSAVDYGVVVHAMALLQQAGVDNVGLITESPPAQVRG